MRTLHSLIGWTFLVTFLATGVWMRLRFPEAHQNDDGVRMMFRASHIHILFTALLNLMAAKRTSSPASGWKEGLRRTGSFLLLISPPLATTGFFFEAAPHRFERPIAHFAVIFAALGTMLVLFTPGKRA